MRQWKQHAEEIASVTVRTDVPMPKKIIRHKRVRKPREGESPWLAFLRVRSLGDSFVVNNYSCQAVNRYAKMLNIDVVSERRKHHKTRFWICGKAESEHVGPMCGTDVCEIFQSWYRMQQLHIGRLLDRAIKKGYVTPDAGKSLHTGDMIELRRIFMPHHAMIIDACKLPHSKSFQEREHPWPPPPHPSCSNTVMDALRRAVEGERS